VKASRRLAAVLLLAALVAGCAQLPWVAPPGNPQAFETQGRVYVRFGAQAFSGSLRWQHAPYADEVWLGGPLGQTAAHIVRNAEGAMLTGADQRVYRSTSIEALTREGLGWTLPLADLSYYVLGAVPPQAEVLERGDNGRLLRAANGGWTVRWVPLDGDRKDAGLQRIELAQDDVEIRFVVDRLERGVAD
jgi:outer membrane lipoprotein LolB